MFRIALLLIVIQFSTAVGAQGLDSLDPRLVGTRPDPSGVATLINVGIYLFDVDRIDDVNQRFSVDMFMAVSWYDPRLRRY